MIILGLTGSIGMGKSTVAAMFETQDVPVWDADAVVHSLYEYNEEVYQTIRRHWPDVCRNACVNRDALAEIVFNDPAALDTLTRLFGRHIDIALATFVSTLRWLATPPPLIVLDIPLLFENRHLVRQCDYVAVVDCPRGEQERRVLARPGMTKDAFEARLARQIPNDEKVKNADIVIDTSAPMLDVRTRVDDIIGNISDDDWIIRHRQTKRAGQ